MNLMNATACGLLAGALSLSLIVPASAQDADADYAAYPNPDPWEPVNRVVFRFNDTLDTYALKPVAKGYDWAMPTPLNDGVTNVFNNLGEPKNLVNNLLQGKFHDASVDLSRFLMNTTLGVVGVFDVATRMGLRRNDEDFGQTLGRWGVESGPYVMLPFFGPSTLRDGSAFAAEGFAGYSYGSQMDHVPSRNTAVGVDIVDTRAGLLSQERLIRGDKYRFIRNAWLQNREYKVMDGQVEDDF
ncbi:phospholipid-binding lipoprotein MlaA [Halopseudomonas litoralis]|uniref:Phospholipid-binding lipoprotein MlaA n=1 Tax=Halopseudomonas litoralis TaxID=797277 RepID=A0A1H1NRX7_9GAMM|nr:VacJ family lipoprotein [Halopseudomonas litoralis]SDS01734.1 phospholipid-binding lipoprotein MlaA [Halopseudomonas litoralis]